MKTTICSLTLAVLVLVCPDATAQAPATDAALLSVDRLFNSGELATAAPPPLKWWNKGYTTLEAVAGGRQLVWHDPATMKREVLAADHWFIPPGEGKPLAVEDYEFSPDGGRLLIYTNSKRVWRANTRGDYWVLDLSSRELRKLGGDIPPSTMLFAKFSPDGKKVAYVQQNNLHVQNLGDGEITKLTNDGSETVINGTFDWVYEEELHLRNGFRWSPDSQHIAYWQLNCEGVREFHFINNLEGPYARVITLRYPKAGERNPAARIGVVNASGGPTKWLNVPGDPREHYLAKMDWVGNEIVLQQFNRLQNTNRLMVAYANGAEIYPILTETDRAWVENYNDVRWLNQGQDFLWFSERDGWQHLYLVTRNGVKIRPITKGAFDVIRLEAVDEKGGWLYFLASPDNPTQRYLYRVSLKGGDPVRLTPADQPGTHGYNISPDAQWAVHTYSTFTRPPVTTLIRLPEHKAVKTFTDNAALQKKMDTLKKCATEFFRVRIGEGLDLDGWCIKPPDFDPTKKYPVLFYVYGEPAGQTVLDRWSDKRLLWHSMLAQQGYLVMSVDNRGTPAPRGRAWRRSLYRQIGILTTADQAAAVRTLLKQRPYMDASRIAVWGWSGGGTMSLNAIFQYPDLYQTAMAIAPVPNFRFYDTIYQERYMGLPADNVAGYRNGSPIHHAHQLKGNLLLVHGTGDDNVHYLGMEALVNELIAHNKHFTLMAYPNRSHGIHEGKNTTRHLYETLTRYLRTHTPPGGRK